MLKITKYALVVLVVMCSLPSCKKVDCDKNAIENNDGVIFTNEIQSIIGYGTPQTCLSIHDIDVTPYDNVNIGFVQVLKITDTLFYMYYGASGTETERDPDTGAITDYRNMVKFAYSYDGLKWIRGFPHELQVKPETGINAIECFAGDRGSYKPSFGSACVFKAYWDSEYPFRIITSDGPLTIFKSMDGVTFTNGREIDSQWRDSQPSVIIRGSTLKIYNRVRPSDGRYIAVTYTDLDGNIISPSRYLFGKDNLYQASAGPLDDRRDILFPTTFKRHMDTTYPYDVQGIECYIVDGNEVAQVSIDSDMLTSNGKFHIIYAAAGGTININGEQFLYYTVSEGYHDVDNQKQGVPDYDCEIRRVKIMFGDEKHVKK